MLGSIQYPWGFCVCPVTSRVSTDANRRHKERICIRARPLLEPRGWEIKAPHGRDERAFALMMIEILLALTNCWCTHADASTLSGIGNRQQPTKKYPVLSRKTAWKWAWRRHTKKSAPKPRFRYVRATLPRQESAGCMNNGLCEQQKLHHQKGRLPGGPVGGGCAGNDWRAGTEMGRVKRVGHSFQLRAATKCTDGWRSNRVCVVRQSPPKTRWWRDVMAKRCHGHPGCSGFVCAVCVAGRQASRDQLEETFAFSQ